MGEEYRRWCQQSNSTSSSPPPSSSSLTAMESFLWPMDIDNNHTTTTTTKTSSSSHTGLLLPIHSMDMIPLRPSYPPPLASSSWNQPFPQGGIMKVSSSDQLQYHHHGGYCSSECSHEGENNMMSPFFRSDDDNYSSNCDMINSNNMDGGGVVISYPDLLRSPPPTSAARIISDLSPPLWNSAGVDGMMIPLSQPPHILHGRIDLKSKDGGSKPRGVVYKKNGKEMGVGKRQRSEAGSGLPAFKVRKEKMGDRITTLQQLVSPFGKTDTASVLSEAIEYIKFLHQQVFVLCAPYINSGAKPQHTKVGEASKDLRSRGLCMVPISSTLTMVNESSVDFLTPTYGGTFR